MKPIFRIFSALLVGCLLLGLLGCGAGPVSTNRPTPGYTPSVKPTQAAPSTRDPAPTDTTSGIDTENRYYDEDTRFTLSGAISASLQLQAAGAEQLRDMVATYAPEFPQADSYGAEDVLAQLQFSISLGQHSHSALDSSGQLTVAGLMQCVQENNRQYLANKPFGYEDVEDSKLQQVCTLIVESTQQMLRRYPDLDTRRIYCNLGALKILNKPGMLSNALVSKDLVMAISPNSESIVTGLQGEGAYESVLIHEVMHILQMGCVCENIPGCDRRAGISLSIPDHPLGTCDLLWLVEASAEQNMCSLRNCRPTTYQTKLAYLHGCTLAILPNPAVAPDTLQTVCFYDEPRRLFEAFGCTDAAQQQALLELLICIQLLDAPPSQFGDATGLDVTTDAFYYDAMSAIGMALSVEFYENLATLLESQTMGTEDLCLLVSLFEAQLNGILHYAVSRHAPYYAAFLEDYVQMRSEFFRVLGEENAIDVADAYARYVTVPQDGVLNARLEGFSEEKQTYLFALAQQLAGNSGLARIIG